MSESDLTLAHTASPKWTSKIFPGMASIDNYRSIVPAEGMKWTYRSLDVSQTAPVTLNNKAKADWNGQYSSYLTNVESKNVK